MSINFDFAKDRENIMIYTDLFSSVLSTQKMLTSDIKQGMLALQQGGKVTLSNGLEVDMSTTAGPMTLQMYMDQLNSKANFVDSMFETIKSYEKNLQNAQAQ